MKELNIIYKNPNELIEYANNNKTHPQKQIDLLANSIKEYGFNVPIVIDKNNIIIAGHGRLLASIKLGLNEVPCIIKDNLSDIQIKKYRLLDNKITELAEDNVEAIKLELGELGDLELTELFGDFGLDFDMLGEVEDNIFNDHLNNESEIFTISLNFDVKDKNKIEKYIKKNGKGEITNLVINHILGVE